MPEASQRKNFDTLIPEFILHVNGQAFPVEKHADLVSISVLQDVNAAGMFTFTLICWDNVKMQVRWIDDDLFKEGNSVDISIGYRDKEEKIFQGEITGLEPDFPSHQPPTLTVRGYDRRHRLMRKRKTRTFLKMKDSDIASQIAGDWGLKPEVEDTKVTLDYVLQHNQTDYAFLQDRARRIGYEVVVNDRTLLFRPRQSKGSATITLKREVELLDFSIRLSSLDQLEEVSVQGWDPKNKAEFIAHSGKGDVRAMDNSSSGPSAVGSAFGDTGGSSVKVPVQSQAEADQLAKSWLAESAMRYVEGDGVCIGRPDLKAGILVSIGGLGKRFSGTYYVTCVEHFYKPTTGYRTAFSVMRNAT